MAVQSENLAKRRRSSNRCGGGKQKALMACEIREDIVLTLANQGQTRHLYSGGGSPVGKKGENTSKGGETVPEQHRIPCEVMDPLRMSGE